MSGCSCYVSHCLNGLCRCLRENSFCSENCSCNGCQNTEDNKDVVESRYKAYWKKKTGAVTRPVNGCNCKTGCATPRCSCCSNEVRCTAKCKCQDCANPKGRRESGTNTKPAQGSVDKANRGQQGLQLKQTTTNQL